MIWWWTPSGSDAVFAQATPLLTTLTGTYGEKFVWSVAGNRVTSSAQQRPNYVVKFPPHDVVFVVNNEPLSVGMEGASLFLDKFKLLKSDFEASVDGTEFHVGENLLVRVGKMRLRQIVIAEFCEIRWNASGSSSASGAYEELLVKLGLPEKRQELKTNFKKVTDVPFDFRHMALQLVHLYDEAIVARG